MAVASGAQPPSECDLAVVGGGILGTAVARELLARRPGASLCLLEGEDRLGRHQTGRSSGVIHAGIYYEPGSLKARLCVEGARELYAYCDERGIPYERSGKLVVAAGESELGRLDELERRGQANQVPGLRRLGGEEIAEIEPHARGVAALHSPATGIVDFVAVAESYAEDVRRAGGSIHTGAPVASAEAGNGRIALRHARGTTTAGAAVFCAGLWSDRLAVACGAPADPRIVPFRGGYLRLPPEAAKLVRANVYPVPEPDLPFLGAHLTRTMAGDVLIGPSALMAPARDAYRLATLRPRDLAQTLAWPGTWRLAGKHWRAALTEAHHAASRRSFVAEAARFVPELRGVKAKPGPAGIRAQALGRDGKLVDDFVVHRTERAIHVRNAPSPAATSSLALARLIADELEAAEA
ncbi:MAG TPA: L-2-hydroxyglutarate oxidase [Solirubrobacterales bacterium]|nr:L-2-hydroxyglutarate oxidase [Solirubrobacterales bacterium]